MPIGIFGELERSELKWNEMHEMNDLKRMNWHEGIQTKEFKLNENENENEMKFKIKMKKKWYEMKWKWNEI